MAVIVMPPISPTVQSPPAVRSIDHENNGQDEDEEQGVVHRAVLARVLVW
jgi:hypothetical protein